MICHVLQQIGISYHTLLHGNAMDELKVRPGCKYFQRELDILRTGKDDCINDMLAGGHGFTVGNGYNSLSQVTYDEGTVQERRDLRFLKAWEQSLAQCLADRKQGRVN